MCRIGWSFGGVVAFEVAKALQGRSVSVDGVILIDSPDPFNHIPLSPSLIDEVLDDALDPEVRRLCKLQFAMNGQLLAKYNPYETRSYGEIKLVFLRSMEGYRRSKEAIPSWLADRSEVASMTRGWELLGASPVAVI